jgi:hypothetical protein
MLICLSLFRIGVLNKQDQKMDLDDEPDLMARGLIRARSRVGMAPIGGEFIFGFLQDQLTTEDKCNIGDNWPVSDRQEVQRNYADSSIASPSPSNQALLCDLARLATVFEDRTEKRPLGSPMGNGHRENMVFNSNIFFKDDTDY